MRILLLILSLMPAVSPAEVYKCAINGRTLYQDRPCDKGSLPATLPPINTIQRKDGDDLAKRYDERLERETAGRKEANAAFIKEHDEKAARAAEVRKAILDHRAIAGMTPGEVESALGSADEKLPDGSWRYRRDLQRISVAFADGRVSGVSVKTEKKKR